MVSRQPKRGGLMWMRAFSGALVTCALLLTACASGSGSLAGSGSAPTPVDAAGVTPPAPPVDSSVDPTASSGGPDLEADPGTASVSDTDPAPGSGDVVAVWLTATLAVASDMQDGSEAVTGSVDSNVDSPSNSDAADEAAGGASGPSGSSCPQPDQGHTASGTATLRTLTLSDLHDLPGLTVKFADVSSTPQPAQLWHAVPLMALSASPSFPSGMPVAAQLEDAEGNCVAFTRQQMGTLDLHLLVPAPGQPVEAEDRDLASLTSLSDGTFAPVQPTLLTWMYDRSQELEVCRGCN